MKKHLHIFCVLLALCLITACANTEPPPAEPESIPAATEEEAEDGPESVSFTAEDGLEISADLYKTASEGAPYIILFHMADSSRGEYAEIAPKLGEMGYNCLAVDQRSGKSRGGVKNLTASLAKEQGLSTELIDALPDMRAALLYAKDELQAEQIIIWGSSYSASLTFLLGSEYPEDIAAILAFSPVAGSEPFPSVDIVAEAAKVNCPVFITVESGFFATAAAEIFESVPVDNKVYFRPEDDYGTHGSPILNEEYSKNGLYWEQVSAFLNSL